MASASDSQQVRRRWEHRVGAVSAVLWSLSGVLLVLVNRTAPGPSSRLRTIGLALALLTWDCLLLAQMRTLLRTRLGARTPTGRRLALATRVLAGLALASSAIFLVRSAIGPTPMPETDPFWILIFVTLLAVILGEIIYALASLFARPTLPAEGLDAQPR